MKKHRRTIVLLGIAGALLVSVKLAVRQWEDRQLTATYLAEVDPPTGDNRSLQAFKLALQKRDFAAAEAFLRRGVAIDMLTVDGCSVLHWMAVDPPDPEAVKWLLEHGANPSLVDRDGWTALHSVAGDGDLATARLLIDHGANVNARLPDGTTPLYRAVLRGRRDMVELLLNRGADPNLGTTDGVRPLDFESGDPIKTLLLKHGAEPGTDPVKLPTEDPRSLDGD